MKASERSDTNNTVFKPEYLYGTETLILYKKKTTKEIKKIYLKKYQVKNTRTICYIDSEVIRERENRQQFLHEKAMNNILRTKKAV